jgi:hypothetical protein
MNIRGEVNKLHINDVGDITQGEDGLFSGQVVFAVAPYAAAAALAPKRNISSHPYYPYMICKTVTIAFVKPSAAMITCRYQGLTASYDERTPPEVDYRPSMREVPISEHPKFEEWAGTPTEPNEGVFDPRTEAFLGWKPDSDLYMVDSFLYPGMTAAVTTIDNNEPNFTDLGSRSDKPAYLIKAPDNREWMLIGLPHRSFEDASTGRIRWQVTREYLLSNPGKFNTKIYDNINEPPAP